jgi:FAD:protein FMN transferase
MRTKFRRTNISFLTAVASTLCLLWSPQANTEQYFTVEKVLSSFFPDSERVGYEILETKKYATKLKSLLGYTPKMKRYVVFVAASGRRTDGYAVIDNQHGRYDPITFAVKMSADFKVRRVEVMVYRGPRGREIMNEGFLGQFIGKGINDPIRVNDDIDAITSATISSGSSAKAVKRAIALAKTLMTKTKAPKKAPSPARKVPPAPKKAATPSSLPTGI